MATPAQVSRVLKAAGFSRSVTQKSHMIRGWSEYTSGFKAQVSPVKPGGVLVRYLHASIRRMSPETRNDGQMSQLQSMKTALEAKGFTAAIHYTLNNGYVMEVTK